MGRASGRRTAALAWRAGLLNVLDVFEKGISKGVKNMRTHPGTFARRS